MKERLLFAKGGLIKRRYLKYFFIFIAILALGIIIKNVFKIGDSSADRAAERMTLKAATANKDLGKDFRVALTNEKGEKIDGVVMRLENVEMREEIIVQGQKASSVAGRSFLVVNLKLVNKLEQAVEINTKDYLRLGVSEGEWLAPDIHNDPVLVQAISTKPTRVAFPVDSDLTHFTLQVGEIAGEKEKVEIDF